MIPLLTADTLPVDQFIRMVPPRTAEQGRALYTAGDAHVQSSEPTIATISVSPPNERPAQVTVRLSGTQVSLSCSCRGPYAWGACKHGIAGVLTLRDYLRLHPPSLWRAVLGQAISTPTPSPQRSAGSNGAIVFSLQSYGHSWLVQPYSLAGRNLPVGHGGNPDIIAGAIEQRKLWNDLKPIRSSSTLTNYNEMPAPALTAAALALGSSNQYNNYWHGSPRQLAGILTLLPACLVYQGDPATPFQKRLRVTEQTGEVQLELSRADADLVVRAVIATGETRMPLHGADVTILTHDPTWALVGDQVLPLEGGAATTNALAQYPDVRIPASDETEFLERFVPALIERIPLSGDAITFENLSVPPEPRLYLSERERDLLAELRFGYEEFELPYSKTTGAQSLRRREDSRTLVRITRDLGAEQAAWESLSDFGLKRGQVGHEFLLRKNVNPIDFLIRQVPRLTEAGFTIFGEDTLKSARVNRNRPEISFKVSSGIDWFDLEATVNFGDQNVPLKEVRRAIRKRERFIKLADGTIGEIPAEWLARYRHLFALAEDTGEDLRLSNHHLGLLDQVLAEADRAQTDTAFQERRERLRNFERIEPQPLPQGFTGTLRPYQQAAFDWMHFLNSYNFGGCLADDMGTGKCVAADTQIFINGTLQTAAAIWERYAGIARFDGEGEWAEPSAVLDVNALDQQTRQIVPARVQRIYRQRVRERMRTVYLDDGSRITITYRHKLLSRDGWTTDFKPGDMICVPARQIWDGNPVDPDLVTLLAWQIAEGHEHASTAALHITQANLTLLEELRQTAHRIGKRYGLTMNQPSLVHSAGKTPALRMYSTTYRRFLEEHGYHWGHRSAEKCLPDILMQGDQASVTLLLRCLFDAEGSVCRNSRGVEFSSASRLLVQQVATLLRRFGIWMRIHTKQKCATNGSRIKRTYYTGTFGGTSVRSFVEQIGFGNPTKQALLTQICALPTNTNVEGVPVSDIVGEMVHRTGLPVRHFGMHNTVYLNGSQQFSRASLQRVVAGIDAILDGRSEQAYRALPRSKWTARTLTAYEQLNHDHLKDSRERLQELVCAEVHYCAITAIEDVWYDGWVYDLEIAKHHNFVAEGILCHNTISTLAFLQSMKEQHPDAPANLIVMPRSLLFNWAREAAQFTPGLRVYTHADQGRITEAADFNKHDLVLTTYGVMLRDLELLRSYKFHYAILDESQAIKNPLAETSRAARALNAEHRLVLTGTPVENSASELWAQFAFLNPGLLGNLDYFREEFVNPIERKQDQDTATFLRKMVHPFILRRTKEQVALDLPPRSEELLEVDMEPNQRKLYNKTRDHYRDLLLGLIDDEGINDARLKVLEGLLRLRQICNHPQLVDPRHRGGSAKLEALLETLDTLRAEGHKALIFSQFVQMLTIVRGELDARKIPYAYLDGSTRKREEVVDRFQQSGPELPFFLISLKAGGVGLNLTAADYVIHVDPWWNPAVEMQATDRTHRIGQTRPVFVYKLITRGTVEEKILQLQARKRALVEQLIAADGSMLKALTREDVEVLFS